ncbi:GGDEF domain-containing protein [Butyrivibrio sp.]|uniref:GGDEF domain-containing protein n=1 Tax=Butyrivibrio sp. TaxID=28121 RepID=UPI0025BC10D5|nr:diguanylate cyclase [Butyrivibrio sp.]
MTLILVIAETIGHIGELYPEKYAIGMKIGYYIIYALDPADYLFAILYINCWLDESKAKCQKEVTYIYRAFMGINFVLVTVSVLFNLDWFYYFDGINYLRGPFFLVRGILILVFCVLLSVYVILNFNAIYSGYQKPILALPLIALAGGCLQVFFTEMNMTYGSIAIGILILFFYLQSKNLDIDYLTGALNRRGIDIVMENNIKTSLSTGHRFSAIMLDLDRFKEINDTYGHNEGDYALKIVSTILFKVFSNEAAIGRFGGDEFCVICSIDSQDELEDRIELIDDELDKWNYRGEKPYKLEVSMGSMIYNPAESMSVKQFQIAIDELMYIQKRKHHLADNRR